jgi:hypothetical protein
MALIVAGALALAGWLAWRGNWRRLTGAHWASMLLVLVAARMAASGKPLAGAVALAGAGLCLWWARRRAVPAPRVDMRIAEARAVLGLGPDADREEIRAAHRKLMQRVHPDLGGNAELSQRVTAARDVLLEELNQRPSRSS